MGLFVLILLAVCSGVFGLVKDNEKITSDNEWWKTASFYQIYPRSYKDSNGDGIGDLNGIREKLPYLKEIGIKAFWMSPIFKSPMADFGYDISDFYSIQPEYGTMGDFEALVKRAKELELKVILDFVPNHSSDENDWFKKSVDRVKGFEDFYIWHPGKPNPENATARPLVPNNWISIFRGSAWEWNDKRKEYYLHQFTKKQPDLNYRCPSVVEQMKDVLTFYMDKGVDGFRIDAVPSLFEVKPDSDGNFPDEPLSGFTNDPDDWNYLIHTYTQDQEDTLDMVYQWRETLLDYQKERGGDERVIMTESYSPLDIVMKYYGNGTRQGAQMPFNFQFITTFFDTSNAVDLQKTIDSWMSKMPAGRVPNWVMGNHDQHRVATRFGEEKIDIMNMILLTLPGISVTYNVSRLTD
jgi:alpha-glucosidase